MCAYCTASQVTDEEMDAIYDALHHDKTGAVKVEDFQIALRHAHQRDKHSRIRRGTRRGTQLRETKAMPVQACRSMRH